MKTIPMMLRQLVDIYPFKMTINEANKIIEQGLNEGWLYQDEIDWDKKSLIKLAESIIKYD